jgi:hypothetical protein
MEIIMDNERHAVCLQHAASDRAATEKFRATAANPDGLVPPPVLRNSGPLRNFLRGGERLHDFEISRQALRARERAMHIEPRRNRRGNF